MVMSAVRDRSFGAFESTRSFSPVRLSHPVGASFEDLGVIVAAAHVKAGRQESELQDLTASDDGPEFRGFAAGQPRCFWCRLADAAVALSPTPVKSHIAGGSGRTSDSVEFNSRVEFARRRRRDTEAQEERVNQASAVEARWRAVEGRRLQEEQEARREKIATTLQAVAAALVASNEKGDLPPDALVLTEQGRVAVSKIPPRRPGSQKTGPEMFGIPNLLRDLAWRRLAKRGHTSAWSTNLLALADRGRSLLLTAQGDLVEGVGSRTSGVRVATNVYVQFAQEVDLDTIVNMPSVCDSILDALADLVVTHELTVNT
jgi:hypothetical protein